MEVYNNFVIMVYVLDQDGKPLLPTERCGKVRRLLKEGLAVIVRRTPFTIQLTYEPDTKVTQKTTLGADLGYTNVGTSVVSDSKELFSGDFKVRIDIQKKLLTKSMYRRNRRSRLRYPKPRFLNRKRMYRDAPSIRHKVDSHIRIIQMIQTVLPVDELVLEIASFDAAKIKNPNIKGVEYQQGEQLGYANVKEYVKSRDGHRCYFNKTEKCTKRLEVHHIVFRSNGGSDKPSNLITLCEKCHKKLHKGNLELPKTMRHKSLRSTSFMNQVSSRLRETLPEAKVTYGYETKQKRYVLDLEKSHTNDAFVIANGTTQERSKQTFWQHNRKNNRALGKQRRGFAPSSRKQRYPIQPRDLIRYEGEIYIASGTHNKGTRIIIPVDGKKKSVVIEKAEHIYYQRTLQALTS